MKVRRQIVLPIITLCLLLNLTIFIPNTSAPPVSPPDQFIAEFFPNYTVPLHLIYTNTVITFNTSDFSHQIDIGFDANYTIFNPENTTNIPIILPFSMATNITDFMYEVYANNTQIPYDLFSISPWNDTITVIHIQFAWFIEIHPIVLIRSNITLLKNSTSVIRYHFNGSIRNPLDSRDLFSIAYHLGTSEAWIGNSTGRVEIRAYGKQTRFSLTGVGFAPCQVVDINGGKSYICEWNNTKNPKMDMGIKYYRESSPFEGLWEIIVPNLLGYIAITTVIIAAVNIRRKRKRIESIGADLNIIV